MENKKEVFETPEVEVVMFENEDVITASGNETQTIWNNSGYSL